MRNMLLIRLSLILFAVVVSRTDVIFAQDNTCDLRLSIVEMTEGESEPIAGARSVITTKGSHTPNFAVLVDGKARFSNLAEGEHRIIITKSGYKRTVQPISFFCTAPDTYAVIEIKMERGSSARTITNEKHSVKAGVVIGSADPVVIGREGPVGRGTVTSSPEGVAPPKRGVIVSGGVLNGRAISLPRPPYPLIAKSARATGTVSVRVTIDEEGNVISAQAVSGHPLLSPAATQAARAAKFSPTRLQGQPVKVTGLINYNFALRESSEP